MLIGELARASGVTVRALRYYEQQGLLQPVRASNGYRQYDGGAVTKVRNIQLLLSNGFTAQDVRDFLPCLDDGEVSLGPVCPPSVEAVTRKVAVLEERIAELSAVRDRLVRALTGDATPQPPGTVARHPAYTRAARDGSAARAGAGSAATFTPSRADSSD
ncbi:MerR family transcriptional regulator [Nonomuraea sp. SMC257]|uniref:MerR family transcriptional regulator n=1 Tax=Nonomuraea montanisoli TaxID=2741721 RepID=A0A7Y6M7L9_9ACTN|nr:MerR family transcriptional regulator [Nonomuraea montanisoli]NUW37607.1 MerR family transcriptional regulator [Nonomuraea montanisoli]